ncbi:MAG TPA: hypothetical protein VNO52_17485 [Methylomirabilota bacterium]|nr:hypothetical protein [Methylomirabilota bacterium]
MRFTNPWLALRALALLALCGVASGGLAAPADERWDFRFGRPGLDGTAIAAVWHDGLLHLGGSFRIAGNAVANSVARWDGTNFWPLGDGLTTEDPYSAVAVVALASFGGRLYAGGYFTRSGARTVSGLACWDGAQWAGVGGVTGRVRSLLVEGPALYVTGALQFPGDTNVYGVARWDGSAWETFGSTLENCPYPQCVDRGVDTVAVLGGELFISGNFTTLAGEPIGYRARWTGGRWEAFPLSVNGSFYQLRTHAGQLFACGYFTSIDATTVTNVARWDGTNWWPVGAGLDGTCDRLFSDGTNLLALGSFTRSGDTPLDKVARWDGTAWQPLGSNIWRSGEQAYALARGPEGELFMAGYFNSVHGQPAGGLARWDGAQWQPLVARHARGVSGSVGFVYALAPTPEALYVGGLFELGGIVPANRIGRLDAAGWSALGAGLTGAANARVSAIVTRGAEVFAAGRFTNSGALAVMNIARWDGAGWQPLGGGLNSNVLALAMAGDRLIAGGEFTGAGGVPARHLAGWDGTAWSEVGGGLNARARALAWRDERLYVGGSFTNAGGTSANRVAIWDGAAWHALGNGIEGSNATVLALALDGTNVYVGGQFRSAGGVAANHVACWNGHEWSALGAGPDNGVQGSGVYALAVWRGQVFVGGVFTNAGGVPANGLARWDGTNWSALGSGLAFPILTDNRARVFALAVSGGELFVGGAFTHAGGQAAAGLARYVLQPEVMFDPPQSTDGDALTLRLRGVAGLRFRLERTTDFSSWSAWTAGRGDGEVWETTDHTDAPASFYRAVIEE